MLAVLVAAAWLGGCDDDSPGGGASPAQQAGRFAELARQGHAVRADNAYLEKRLAAPGAEAGWTDPELLDRLEQADDASRAALAEMLAANVAPFRETVEQVGGEHLAERNAKLQSNLAAANQKRFELEDRLFEMRATRRAAGWVATLFSPENRGMFVWGVVAAAGLAGTVLHHRRHELRQLLHGGRARNLGLAKWFSAAAVAAGLFAVAVLVFGDAIHRQLLILGAEVRQSPGQERAGELADVAAAIQQAEATNRDLASRFEQHLSAGRELVRRRTGSEAVAREWEQTHRALREMAVAARVQQGLAADWAAAVGDARELAAEHARVRQETAGDRQRAAAVRAGVGGAGLLVILAATLILWRSVARERKLVKNTCPMCLGYGKLSEVAAGPNGSAQTAAPPGGTTKKGAVAVRCSNRIVSVNDYGEEQSEDCSYQFMSVYRPIPKVCFPLLGVPSSGKTVFALMVSRLLNQGQYPPHVHFERIRSPQSERYDRVLDALLSSKVEPEATQTDKLPSPLVFGFRDADRLWGRSQVLVNLFDYSGEIVHRPLTDLHRQRALDADGYLFLLDPTRPAEPQANAMHALREDIRVSTGLDFGQQVRVPIAICMTKLDLLAEQPYASHGGGGAVEQFFQDLYTADPTGDRVDDLGVMEKRSALVARLRELIWPGWEVEKQIVGLFGGRCLFFPTTAFGLDDLGAPLAEKTIVPFGLLEPLLWLLHMNGYPVLKRGESKNGKPKKATAGRALR